MTRNPFRDPALRGHFEDCLRVYRAGRMLHPNGKPVGNTTAANFWRGLNAIPMNWDRASRQSFAYASYRAGEAARKDFLKTRE